MPESLLAATRAFIGAAEHAGDDGATTSTASTRERLASGRRLP